MSLLDRARAAQARARSERLEYAAQMLDREREYAIKYVQRLLDVELEEHQLRPEGELIDFSERDWLCFDIDGLEFRYRRRYIDYNRTSESQVELLRRRGGPVEVRGVAHLAELVDGDS